MAGNPRRVGWTKNLAGAAGWVTPDGEFLLSKGRLRGAPRNLRDPQVAALFETLIGEPGGIQIRQWLNRVYGTGEDEVLLLDFPDGAWDIPWELLISRDVLGPSATLHMAVCLARTAGKGVPFAPDTFTEPLKTLVVRGAVDGLDLDRDVRTILSAWAGLEVGAQRLVAQPVVSEPRPEGLPLLLQEYTPHILWFIGHGSRKRGRVEIKLADGQWVDARTLAALIRQSGHCPLYAVFWACETAQADPEGGQHGSPSLFKELARIGVLAVMAMQSPIRDASALALTQDVFRHLARGLPLERALARVRVRLRDHPPAQAHKMDWASPVVWVAGLPVEKLRWADDSQRLAQYQVLGRYVLSAGARPQQLDAPVSPDERDRASLWTGQSRMWIQGEWGEAEHQSYWLRALHAIQVLKDWPVLAVDLGGGEPGQALRVWAEKVHGCMLQGDFPDPVPEILSEIMRSPATGSGWQRLCRLPGLFLAVANPPPYPSASAEWFWAPLLDREGRVAVLSSQLVTEAILSAGWTVDSTADWLPADKLGVRDSDAIATAAQSAPRLANALAVLNMPLWDYQLEIPAGPDDEAASYLTWPEAPQLMLDTAAGPTMRAGARRVLLDHMGSAELEQAHSNCVFILGHPDLVLTEPLREHRLDHLQASNVDPAVALQEAVILFYIYYEEDRPTAVRRLFERLDDLYLPVSTLLIVAWAYLQLGMVEDAHSWLPDNGFADLVEAAWAHSMRSEIFKSAGSLFSPDRALAEIEAAIELCEQARHDNPKDDEIGRCILRYRQDRARIRNFLFYDPESAAAEYGELVQEWRDRPGLDLAIVQRNYAECLRQLAPGPGDPQWARAKALLQEAKRWASPYPQATVIAEVLYEEAKVAEAEARGDDARRLLEECRQLAHTSGHYMLAALADNRLFWSGEPFSTGRWQEIAQALGRFSPHGWAVRTLLNGRLHAARLLAGQGDVAAAFTQLEANRVDLERNPALDRARGDRDRIVRTMAGLQRFGEKMGAAVSFWQEFLSRYGWARDWLAEHALTCTADVWQEVR